MSVPRVLNAGSVRHPATSKVLSEEEGLKLPLPGIETCFLNWSPRPRPMGRVLTMIVRTPLEDQTSEERFWNPVSLEELERTWRVSRFEEQRHAATSIWESDEEVEGFVTQTYNDRMEDLAPEEH